MRRLAKSQPLILAFLLVVVLSAASVAQKGNNLVLSGSVAKVQAYCYEGRPPMAWLDLVMQFRNDGSEPLIVIEPNLLLFNGKAYFGTSPQNLNGISTEIVFYNPYKPEDPFSKVIGRDDYDYRSPLLKSIASKAPRVINPGGYHEFATVLLLSSGFRFAQEPARDKRTKCAAAPPPIPEHDSLVVEYRLSATRLPSISDTFLRDLADRWKPQGKLQLDGSGDLIYRSQPIILARNSS